MPTVITHAAVPLLLGAAAGPRQVSRRRLAAGAVAAMLPDADVIGFRWGIAYTDALGHRGATHSVAAALLLGLLAMAAHRWLRTTPWRALLFVGLAVLSHPLLDAMTDGGLGVAFFWPWDDHRYFLPWRPILVSPIGAGFFSARGLETLESEVLWVWLPLAVVLGVVESARRDWRPRMQE